MICDEQINDRLKNLEHCLQLREDFVNRFNELSTPLLADMSLIDEFYAIYSKNMRMKKTVKRKVFVFVILYFYCPAALIKARRLSNGLRDKLASVMNSQSTTISHDYMVVKLYYDNYPDFRELVMKAYMMFDIYLYNKNNSK